jgi:hypothetical protein
MLILDWDGSHGNEDEYDDLPGIQERIQNKPFFEWVVGVKV